MVYKVLLKGCTTIYGLLISRGGYDIIDLEDHLYDLGGEQELLLLPNESLKDLLLAHIVGAHVQAVNTQERTLLLQWIGTVCMASWMHRALRDRTLAQMQFSCHCSRQPAALTQSPSDTPPTLDPCPCSSLCL